MADGSQRLEALWSAWQPIGVGTVSPRRKAPKAEHVWCGLPATLSDGGGSNNQRIYLLRPIWRTWQMTADRKRLRGWGPCGPGGGAVRGRSCEPSGKASDPKSAPGPAGAAGSARSTGTVSGAIRLFEKQGRSFAEEGVNNPLSYWRTWQTSQRLEALWSAWQPIGVGTVSPPAPPGSADEGVNNPLSYWRRWQTSQRLEALWSAWQPIGVGS